MQQFRLILAVVLFAGSDAFFLNMFKSKLKPVLPPPPIAPQAYNYNRPPSYSPAYAPPPPSYSSYEPYKIPVWQAMPSGYVAQPYTPSIYDQRPSTNYYSTPDTTPYGGASYQPASNPYVSGASYQPAPIPYVGGNTVIGNSPDYTGGSPMISVPVYFPKDAASGGGNLAPIPTSYSNGVSGFYDSSIAGSSVSVVGQAVPVPVPITTT